MWQTQLLSFQGSLRSVVFMMCATFAVLTLLAERSVVSADENVTRERRYHEFSQQRLAIQEGLRSDLEAVIRWCQERQLPEAAEQVVQVRSAMEFLSQAPQPPEWLSCPCRKHCLWKNSSGSFR